MSALLTQVGGSHYMSQRIQPVEYIEANNLGFLEGCVLKRITRHDCGGKGRQDIEKAIHELQLLLELRYPQGQAVGEAVASQPSYCPHCHSFPCSCQQGGTEAGKYASHPSAALSSLGQWPETPRCVRCLENPCRCGYMTGVVPAEPHDPYSRR